MEVKRDVPDDVHRPTKREQNGGFSKADPSSSTVKENAESFQPEERPTGTANQREDDINQRRNGESDRVQVTSGIRLLSRQDEKGERDDNTDEERDQRDHGSLPALARMTVRAAMTKARVKSR